MLLSECIFISLLFCQMVMDRLSSCCRPVWIKIATKVSSTCLNPVQIKYVELLFVQIKFTYCLLIRLKEQT